jgi:hypothetical protein
MSRSSGLHRFNILALVVNALIGLHFSRPSGTTGSARTWTTAQCRHPPADRRAAHRTAAGWSSASSTWVEGRVFVRRYHGYYFAWATVYTFWYHPMVNTSGHLIGFFYMFLLLLQGSLFFTRAHVNRRWTVVLEVTFAIHGGMVAYLAGQGWQMFLLGGLAMFIITQMHGLGLSRRARWLIALGYGAGVAALYSGRGVDRLPELAGIPLTLLAGVFVLALVWAAAGAQPA